MKAKFDKWVSVNAAFISRRLISPLGEFVARKLTQRKLFSFFKHNLYFSAVTDTKVFPKLLNPYLCIISQHVRQPKLLHFVFLKKSLYLCVLKTILRLPFVNSINLFRSTFTFSVGSLWNTTATIIPTEYVRIP